MTARVTAGEPLPLLLHRWARAGWGDLAGREWQGVRSTLNALATRLPHKGAAGLVTVWDVAQAAGLSERWTRRCLAVLEDIGLIYWSRGGLQAGKPLPSYIKVIKRSVVDLILAARGIHAHRERAHTTATAERLKPWRGKTFKSLRHPRRSGHAALSASPHPPKGGSNSHTPTPSKKGTPEMKPKYPRIPPVEQLDQFKLVGDCQHGWENRRQCPQCRARAMTDAQIADFEAQLIAFNNYARGYTC